MDWRLGLSRRVPALHVQSPELKKKKKVSLFIALIVRLKA
jgi:hypothetical protein